MTFLMYRQMVCMKFYGIYYLVESNHKCKMRLCSLENIIDHASETLALNLDEEVKKLRCIVLI